MMLSRKDACLVLPAAYLVPVAMFVMFVGLSSTMMLRQSYVSSIVEMGRSLFSIVMMGIISMGMGALKVVKLSWGIVVEEAHLILLTPALYTSLLR